LGTQRNDSRAADIADLTSCWSELKEVVAGVRHDVRSHQEQLDVWQTLEVNKATTELRAIVQDLSLLSQAQGDKLCALEFSLQEGREAKAEVLRVSRDLAAEKQTRTKKYAELQARLESEVHEFGRRVERLTGATSELGGSLRDSESRRHSLNVYSGAYSASQRTNSISSFRDDSRRSSLNLGSVETPATESRGCDAVRSVVPSATHLANSPGLLGEVIYLVSTFESLGYPETFPAPKSCAAFASKLVSGLSVHSFFYCGHQRCR